MKSIKEQKLNYQNLVATDTKLYCKSTFEIAGDGFDAGVESAQRWIPVEEELPKMEGIYLTKSENGYVCTMSYKRGMWSTMGYQSDIKYWRPIEYK